MPGYIDAPLDQEVEAEASRDATVLIGVLTHAFSIHTSEHQGNTQRLRPVATTLLTAFERVHTVLAFAIRRPRSQHTHTHVFI